MQRQDIYSDEAITDLIGLVHLVSEYPLELQVAMVRGTLMHHQALQNIENTYTPIPGFTSVDSFIGSGTSLFDENILASEQVKTSTQNRAPDNFLAIPETKEEQEEKKLVPEAPNFKKYHPYAKNVARFALVSKAQREREEQAMIERVKNRRKTHTVSDLPTREVLPREKKKPK